MAGSIIRVDVTTLFVDIYNCKALNKILTAKKTTHTFPIRDDDDDAAGEESDRGDLTL
jgi:hypothetical protein